MRLVNKIVAVVMTAGTLFSCQKEKGLNTEASSDITAASEKKEFSDEGANLSGKGKKDGYVYTLSNQTSGNTVLVYRRAENGTLTFNASYAAGGNGTGGGLGNQGAVILSDDDMLLAVNAGSNSISSFKINNGMLTLKSTVSSGGMRPVSLTQHDDIVFVLNAGGTNNISGFKLMENGMLQAIPNSTRLLSAASTGPAQISFVNGGKVLVVTEKATDKIISYTVNNYGIPGIMHSITSSSPTPFGFAVGKHENIFVSEAVGGAPGASVLSSYSVSNNGVISLINGSVGAGQSAACWVVVTNNGKFAYTTNTASDNISTFGVKNNGEINVSQAISATTQAGPIDAVLSDNSKYLYILNSGGHSIQSYDIADNGTLSPLQTVSGLPIGANGLASD